MQHGFSDLGLSQKVLEAVTAAGYTTPTPIQASAIPVASQGRDVLGIAQTGTGKTAAFVLPMLSRLERGRARARMPRSLILAPTRELAAQVTEHFGRFGGNHKLTVALLIGGVSFDEQNRKLDRGADVLIATPGRLLDHIQRGKLLLTGVEILVIDEADRMLDMGFIPDIERICALLPPTRQTLFFSATMPPEIQRLVDRFLKAPERIEATPPATTAGTITQRFCRAPADPAGKRAVLRDLIRGQAVKNAIIFCNRKRDVAILHRSLLRHGFNAGALHGDLDQHQRTATLDAFRAGTLTLLAASDVAARGLDIPEVSHIFNYDVPLHSDDYVHRIGRTGRAGREGFSATLVTPLDGKLMRGIEKMVGGPIEWLAETDAAGGGRGRQAESREGAGEARRADRPRERGDRERAASDRTDRERPDRDRRRRRGGRDRTTGPTTEQATDRMVDQTTASSSGAEAVAQPAMAQAALVEESRTGGRAQVSGDREQRSRQARPKRTPAPQEDRQPQWGEELRVPSQRGSERGAQRRGRHGEGRSHARAQGEPLRPSREEGSVLGMGDHVPDFMKRPVKQSAKV